MLAGRIRGRDAQGAGQIQPQETEPREAEASPPSTVARATNSQGRGGGKGTKGEWGVKPHLCIRLSGSRWTTTGAQDLRRRILPSTRSIPDIDLNGLLILVRVPALLLIPAPSIYTDMASTPAPTAPCSPSEPPARCDPSSAENPNGTLRQWAEGVGLGLPGLLHRAGDGLALPVTAVLGLCVPGWPPNVPRDGNHLSRLGRLLRQLSCLARGFGILGAPAGDDGAGRSSGNPSAARVGETEKMLR